MDVKLYLIVIAIADIAIAIFCIPFTFTETMMGRWIFYSALCPLSLSMQVLSVSVSIFTKVALGIDRYMVTLKPLIRRPSAMRFRITMLIILTLAICLSLPMAIVNRVDKYQLCTENWKKKWMRKCYSILLLILTYILPLIILGSTCSRISIYLWRLETPGNAHQVRDELQLKAKRNTIRILIIVVMMFALSWLPLQIFNLVVELIPNKIEQHQNAAVYCFLAFHWLSVSNSWMNSVVYSFMNKRFRCDMKDLLTKSYLNASERNSLYNLRAFTFPRKSSCARTGYHNGRKEIDKFGPRLKNNNEQNTPTTGAQLLQNDDR
ncbi:DgyrCDS11830 [Dimorphilus gyrociliatus]|uniref:DgyrCDS11830 n=1 Tax=Dimorphilus gyrociliatus TaxID=2664684 RepID=A0A7I8W4K7_9ANNE|nr:DgyrCDS11830 [Dimorphilus gyrociliatus]